MYMLATGVVHMLTAYAAETAPVLNRTGWNAKVRQQFMHPPVFTYEPVATAAKYICAVSWQDGKEAKSATLESGTPEFDLAEVWAAMPAAGAFVVTVSAVDAQGKVLATSQTQCTRKADFKGPYRSAKAGYDDSGARAAAWVLKANPGPGAYPILFYSSYIRQLTTYVRLNPKGEMAGAALERAKHDAQALLNGSTPGNWVYANVPMSHPPEPRVFQVGRGGMAGMAYLDLYQITQDKTWFDAATRIADTLKKNQLPEGRWPWRVDPKTGKIVEIPHPLDHTSDQVEAILLLDELIGEYGRKEYSETRDKAVAWMLDNPCKTFLWQHQWDDTFTSAPYENLEWYDTGLFVEYLLRHATPRNGYEAIASDLARYIEDQFVEWEPIGNEITPGAREQYICYAIIDWHCAHYIRVCIAFYAKTGDDLWLEKARALADTLTAVQHFEGFYPTWMSHKPTAKAPTELKDINYGNVWANCTSYTGEMLLRLGECVKPISPQ